AEPVERRQVEVIPVDVRDQDQVDGRDRLRPYGLGPAQVADAAPQHRVGEDARALELDEHGAVPEPGQAPGLHCDHQAGPAAGTASVPAASPAGPPLPWSVRRHPARISWTCSAPTISPSGSGSPAGASRNARVCGPPMPPWNEISSSNAQPCSSWPS